jgi:hypothetical protein
MLQRVDYAILCHTVLAAGKPWPETRPIMEHLLLRGADINQRGSVGDDMFARLTTPLVQAVERQRWGAAEFFI